MKADRVMLEFLRRLNLGWVATLLLATVGAGAVGFVIGFWLGG